MYQLIGKYVLNNWADPDWESPAEGPVGRGKKEKKGFPVPAGESRTDIGLRMAMWVSRDLRSICQNTRWGFSRSLCSMSNSV